MQKMSNNQNMKCFERTEVCFRRPPTGDLVSRLVLSHSEDLAVIRHPQSQMDGFIRAPVVVGGGRV